jgi:hypothetical protein
MHVTLWDTARSTTGVPTAFDLFTLERPLDAAISGARNAMR